MSKTIGFRTGLLGEHLSHSFSPQIHRALVGERYTYEIFERDPADVEGFINAVTASMIEISTVRIPKK